MSETSTVVEINCTTGEVTERPLTAEEAVQFELDKQRSAERRAIEDAEALAKAEAKSSAEAKLAALGLTAEEIAAL
jgi:hypothetical protein